MVKHGIKGKSKRGTAPPEQPPSSHPMNTLVPKIPDSSDFKKFFDIQVSPDDFQVYLTSGPEVKGALLRQRGPPPLIIGKNYFSNLIASVYEFGPEHVRRIVHGYEDHPEKK